MLETSKWRPDREKQCDVPRRLSHDFDDFRRI